MFYLRAFFFFSFFCFVPTLIHALVEQPAAESVKAPERGKRKASRQKQKRVRKVLRPFIKVKLNNPLNSTR
jgi:hypothetical protein